MKASYIEEPHGEVPSLFRKAFHWRTAFWVLFSAAILFACDIWRSLDMVTMIACGLILSLVYLYHEYDWDMRNCDDMLRPNRIDWKQFRLPAAVFSVVIMLLSALGGILYGLYKLLLWLLPVLH